MYLPLAGARIQTRWLDAARDRRCFRRHEGRRQLLAAGDVHKYGVMSLHARQHKGAPPKLTPDQLQFVQLEKLPAYAPDLNPDEGVWQHLKHVEMRNLYCTDLHHLSVELNLAVKRLHKKPSLIQSFFVGAGLDI